MTFGRTMALPQHRRLIRSGDFSILEQTPLSAASAKLFHPGKAVDARVQSEAQGTDGRIDLVADYACNAGHICQVGYPGEVQALTATGTGEGSGPCGLWRVLNLCRAVRPRKLLSSGQLWRIVEEDGDAWVALALTRSFHQF